MSVVKEVTLPKEVYELGHAVKVLLVEYKKAVADGFQVGQDVPAVLLNSLQALMAAMEGVDKIDDEFKETPVMASMAIVLPVMEGLVELMKKDDK